MINIDLNGQTAVVTGATRGIGEAVANALFEAGANLILTGTKKEEVDKRNGELAAKGIKNVEYLQVELSNRESTANFLNTLESCGRIDICVNNAGVNKIMDFVDTGMNDFAWIQNINLYAPYRILKVIGPKMIAHRYGRIVNIASIWSVITRQGRSMYAASKTALVGLTRALAVEWAQYDVLVNAVSPGFTLTELTKTTNTPEQLQAIEQMIPAKRMAEPVEVARMIAFLCSPMNTYLTGQNITIDGGYTNV